ncbi:DNA starvation/stationary phase protection protein [Paenibacillus sp. 7124]|uniref:DNA starvation/stationary phase protection protein n=1 Tax=Paenibacillus apii TaxID=1850370 RepID=A0A6M1PT42_9BACL|nr:DNA starvation/stationary phase protection protein [Paenibacillus apii]NGM84863.1 DNA starvation/stationary phase protection protein [Paenibacillus apii]NJJ41883.1 DNA starvation/stationary phase protection protein [Paenibacillus apii]
MSTDLKTQTELHAVLNRQTANWTLLGIKLHHYHWFVTGTDFFTLHSQFEEYYNEAAGYVDELAERLLAIGGKPASTMKEYLALSSLQEATGGESAKEMVAALAKDYALLAEELSAGITLAEASGDQPTGDLFIGIRTNVEKHVWMLNAYLG